MTAVSLQGASRDSLVRLREQSAGAAGEAIFPGELLAVAALLGRETALRTTLTDPATPPEARARVVASLLGDRLSASTVDITQAAARARWSRTRDLPDALEILGVQAAFAGAEQAGRLDAVEDELFRFGRALDAQPELRAVLEDPAIELDQRVQVLRDLLSDRADATTLALLEHVVRSLRGRRLEEAVDELVSLAAERNAEIVADVRVASPIDAVQEQRLTAALGRVYSRAVRLQVSVDPAVLGGAVVTVGDEVIDGTVLHKLDQARRRLAG